MIYVEMYAHTNINDSTICFEKQDFKIVGITNADFLLKEDFDQLLESIMETDETKDLKPETFYWFEFKAVFDTIEESGCTDRWFELITVYPMNHKTQAQCNKAAETEFANVGDEGLFPNHSDKDIWISGFESAIDYMFKP